MLEIGSVIDGKYKILNIVGKGGMSVVYLAMNERANKQWAIKEVRKDGVQDFEVVKQNLIVETELLKKLRHPHLPSIIDVIDNDDTFLIVMDYIEGNPLSKALEVSGPQSQEDVIEWAKQLCDVLGYLHSRKPPIIYRDMKPSNVMLKPDGNVMLIDFGTAREFKSTSVEDTKCLGTQGYAAPEQFGGHGQTDARTDIYCLGATMYHLVTGHNPCNPPYEMYPIRQWNPMLSSGLEEIILKCTQRNPNDRYQSCAELLYALDHFQELDIENKKVQSLKWKTFLASIILTLVMLFSTVGFSVVNRVYKSSTYDSYISSAETLKIEDPQTAVDYYISAIETEPDKIDGYTGIMEIYKNDNKLTPDEYNQIAPILDQYQAAIQEKNPQQFADDFEYSFARYLFLNYDGPQAEGIKRSSKFFDDVTKYSADENKKKMSQILGDIAKNYDKIGTSSRSADGETEYSKTDYWNQLNELVEMARQEMVSDSNSQPSIFVFCFVANTISENVTDFKNNGITTDQINHALDTLESCVKEYRSSSEYSLHKSEDEENLKSIEDAIANTRAVSNGNGNLYEEGE